MFAMFCGAVCSAYSRTELCVGSTTIFTNKYNTSAPTSEKTQSASIPKTNCLLRFLETFSVYEIYVRQNGVDNVVRFLGYDVISDISEECAATIFGVSASHAFIR